MANTQPRASRPAIPRFGQHPHAGSVPRLVGQKPPTNLSPGMPAALKRLGQPRPPKVSY